MNKTIRTLIEEYRECASAHGNATFRGDYKAANRNHDRLIALVPEIRAYGRPGELALLSLTGDKDEAVACWSATHSLKFDENHALAVLGELAKNAGPIGFNAKMVVQQWNKGQLVLP